MTGQEHRDGSPPYVIGMDLGGTKILAAVVDAEGRILAEAKRATGADDGPDAVIKRMARTARRAARSAGVEWSAVTGLGVGAPGPIDPESGFVYNPPNLPGWDEIALAPRLSAALDLPVFLENDVNLGTLGEHALGAGPDLAPRQDALLVPIHLRTGHDRFDHLAQPQRRQDQAHQERLDPLVRRRSGRTYV